MDSTSEENKFAFLQQKRLLFTVQSKNKKGSLQAYQFTETVKCTWRYSLDFVVLEE